MHHRKTLAEDMNTGEAALLENMTAALTLEKSKPQQHDDSRTEIERMGDELFRELERGIRYDRRAAWR